jgi:hypothetical protein
MPKILEKVNNKKIILFSVVFVMLLGIGFCIVYAYPRNINCSYDGIKYQAGSNENVESVKVYVEGKLRKRLFNKGNEFSGKVIMDDIHFDYLVSSLKFDNKGLGLLEYRQSSNMNLYGNMLISGMFKNITIQIFEKDNGGNSWDSTAGWLISAPCNNREEAVVVSNVLIKRLNKEAIIK